MAKNSEKKQKKGGIPKESAFFAICGAAYLTQMVTRSLNEVPAQPKVKVTMSSLAVPNLVMLLS